MLTQGDDVEVHALAGRGWSISAIARHLERDRKTVRSYLNGDRQPGVRVTAVDDPLAEFEVYIRARFADDPHLWATSLFVEVTALEEYFTDSFGVASNSNVPSNSCTTLESPASHRRASSNRRGANSLGTRITVVLPTCHFFR